MYLLTWLLVGCRRADVPVLERDDIDAVSSSGDFGLRTHVEAASSRTALRHQPAWIHARTRLLQLTTSSCTTGHRDTFLTLTRTSWSIPPRLTKLEWAKAGVVYPPVSPADGHLTTPCWQGCQVCVKMFAQLPQKLPNFIYPLSSHWATSPIVLSGQE